MRRLILAVPLGGALVASACGGGSGGPNANLDAAGIQEKLVSAGIPCPGSAHPHEASSDDIDLDVANPIEELSCTSTGGATIDIAV